MTREILFKAKRKDNNEWVYGLLCYAIPCNSKNQCDVVLCIQTEYGDYEVILETVCQYTGKNDNNGKKIFENDIVEEGCNGFISSVIYDNDIGTYKLKDLGDYYIKDASIEWEVIGNIFDEENK